MLTRFHLTSFRFLRAWPLMLVAGLCLLPAAAGARAPAQELEAMARAAVTWVETLRDQHRHEAQPLPQGLRDRLEPFFPEEVLDAARLTFVNRIETPDFISARTRRGQPVPFDTSRAAAIALVDTVLIVGPKRDLNSPDLKRVIFHELVHLVQYREFGLDPFVRRYLQAWVEAGSYAGNPFEVQAFDLSHDFTRGAQPFKVEERVREAFGLGGP